MNKIEATEIYQKAFENQRLAQRAYNRAAHAFCNTAPGRKRGWKGPRLEREYNNKAKALMKATQSAHEAHQQMMNAEIE